MIYQLEQEDFYKVYELVNGTNELSVEAVLKGTSPGEVYADDKNLPTAVLVKAPECNLVAGNPENKAFNEGIKNLLDWFDQITFGDDRWERKAVELHNNIALKRYTRRHYILKELKYTNYNELLDSSYVLELVTSDSLDRICYENGNRLREWLKISDVECLNNTILGAFVRHENRIVSWSMVDCIVGERIEIGVYTEMDHKRKGLGAIVAAALVEASLNNGIKEIGWHCVDTNKGSSRIAEKVGFQLQQKYTSFTPFPPIENTTDIDADEWIEWAQYYEEKNKQLQRYNWQAAQCWAKAGRMEETIRNMEALVQADQLWFMNHMKHIPELDAFKGRQEWDRLMDQLAAAQTR